MVEYECKSTISDEEIISSLEVIATTRNCNECKIRNCKWGTCNCEQITANAALDLITRQKVEIERLKKYLPKCVYEYISETTEYCVQGPCSNFETVEQIKAEAYKEFAETIRITIKAHTVEAMLNSNTSYDVVDALKDIDNTLKEMVD